MGGRADVPQQVSVGRGRVTGRGVQWGGGRALALGCATVVLAACRGGEPPSVTMGEVTTVSTSTGVGTAPTFSFSPGGDRAVAWISAPGGGPAGRLYVSVNGAAPSVVSDPLAPVQVHSEAPPRIMFGPGRTLYALYVVAKDIGRRFPVSALRFVRSDDRGRSWSPPVTVTDDSILFGSHNFHSLYVAPEGTLYAAWLDGREGKSATYVTHSVDGGRTWARNQKISVGETCPCCRTAIAAGANGVVYAAWRAVFPGSVRDIVVARSADRGVTWGAPRRVHDDGWVFAGCPHAGPAVQVDAAGRIHVLWWTGRPGHAGVFYAVSKDGGQTFTPALAVSSQGVPVASHVQLAMGAGGRVVTVWDDVAGETPAVYARVSPDTGATFGAPVRLSAPGVAAQYPVAGIAGRTAYVAWSQLSGGEVPDIHGRHGGEPMKMGLRSVGNTHVMMRTVHL